MANSPRIERRDGQMQLPCQQLMERWASQHPRMPSDATFDGSGRRYVEAEPSRSTTQVGQLCRPPR